MMSFFSTIRATSAALLLCAGAAFAETPVLRAAVLEFGTVNWELDSIKHNGFDTANGFDLQVQGVAGGSAAQVAFQGGEADVIVSDWLWVARQRAEGKDYIFVPYSKAVGALLIPEGSTATSLADLKGGKIGIAGGPLDKSWLILRAYAEKMHGMDLVTETEQVFGAPPLIFKTGLQGELDGAINFWHFLAKMEAGGMTPLITVDDAARELGLDPETPLLGYVMRGEMLRDHPELVEGLAAASRATKDLLVSSDAEWDRLRPRMNAKSDAEFAALKAGFIAGIPANQPVDEDAAARMLALMAELGGEKLVGAVTTLPEGVFVQPGS
ncbi:ABC transporter substrate-binding protein [Marivita cryptomonadis]|uniref:ABC transporter substrate-binding protein n=2 Tax=Marivita TaxID=659428 RepID=A0A9Q2RXN4_9RHOB|nr:MULTISPECIES: ABC transporter substrate-binding protein [Marivita]MCR9167647.1 ABC transporter substrate-binding protein [Paracoccaceae bacterium]MBM2322052.1 ABC transporter substrate-binding protein [Marivita cryptomonadis]MBM2331633.1 ABC transporter substrate-binding protein [Marivita cryptomonadis]MBM2341218.1 ABC transporter substrate-binding protein [Marivita cryptomonadis]MBM2345881.1 ABC transporter substrate-binding protein [Marivita cryptomonadis]